MRVVARASRMTVVVGERDGSWATSRAEPNQITIMIPAIYG